MDLSSYIKACYPILYIETAEEARAEFNILATCQKLGRGLTVWSYTEGFMAPNEKGDFESVDRIEDPVKALQYIQNQPPQNVFIMKDFHQFLTVPKTIRLVRDIARDFKQSNKTLIILSPVKKIPPELERDVTVLEFDLPDKEAIKLTWDSLYTCNKQSICKILGEDLSDDEQERIVNAALGLTINEAEAAFAKATVDALSAPEIPTDPKWNPTKAERKAIIDSLTPISMLVMKEKANVVKKTGILEYFDVQQTANDIGGLESLKKWLEMRSLAFSSAAREFGLPMPRGMLLVGLPGCGKSLSAKAASNILGVPLIRFDIGRVFGGLVGESEANMRLAIQTAEAVGSCVLWIDEMEKAFAGMGGSGSSDGGTGKRVFGNFITWMQEKTKPCFIIATVNNIDVLPPELLRKGRFDEIFFVGLPNEIERKAIIEIHIKKYNRDLKDFDQKILDKCVEESKDFSGAELEEAIVTGLYAAFSRVGKKQKLNTEDILAAIKETNPLAKSKKNELQAMADWAKDNALDASATLVNKKSQGRKVQLTSV